MFERQPTAVEERKKNVSRRKRVLTTFAVCDLLFDSFDSFCELTHSTDVVKLGSVRPWSVRAFHLGAAKDADAKPSWSVREPKLHHH